MAEYIYEFVGLEDGTFIPGFQSWGAAHPAIEIGASTNALTITSSAEVFDPTADVTVRSFVAATPLKAKTMLWVFNMSGAYSVTLPHGDPAGTDGHRLWTPDGSPFVLGPYRQAMFIFFPVPGRQGFHLFA